MRFIIVDDDPVNNMLCKFTINKAFGSADIKCFEFPVEGLEYISSDYKDESRKVPTILLLDINMPEISGWDFLDEFSKMPQYIQAQFTIYIVSSSIDPMDKKKAEENILIKDYLSKPVGQDILKKIAE